MTEKVNLNQPLLKSETGLLLDPEDIRTIHNKKMGDKSLEDYTTRFEKNSNAPIPNIEVPYSSILTKATPPEMEGLTESGLLIKKLKVDERMAAKLKIMSENVSDEQEVLLIGPYVNEGLKVNPGDKVKINYNRFRTLHDRHASGMIETEYEIPLYVINDNEYLLIDARDVLYVIPNKK